MRNKFETYPSQLSSEINRLKAKLEMARSESDDPKYIKEAAGIGCATLEWLIEDNEFRNDLDRLYYDEEKTQDFYSILENPDQFRQFLNLEKKLLRLGGLREDVAEQLIEECWSVYEDVHNNGKELYPVDLRDALYNLKERTCNIITDQRKILSARTLEKRVLLGLGGALVIGINASSLAATFGLTIPGSQISIAFGGALIGKAI